MAGSWGHIVDDDGTFIGGALLENGGDVQEALLECYGMVWWLATEMATVSGMEPYTPETIIETAQENYHLGIARSPSRLLNEGGSA